jgi:hypothetical protein
LNEEGGRKVVGFESWGCFMMEEEARSRKKGRERGGRDFPTAEKELKRKERKEVFS